MKEWIGAIGVGILVGLIVRSIYHAADMVSARLDELHEKVDVLVEKMGAIEEKQDEIEDRLNGKRYVNPIDL